MPYFGLALIYKQDNEFEKAEYYFNKAVDKKKDFPPLLISLGKLNQLQGEYEEAIPYFEKALEIVGVGYRAELKGRMAVFNLGYSHPINFQLTDGIDANIEKLIIELISHQPIIIIPNGATGSLPFPTLSPPPGNWALKSSAFQTISF